LNAEKGKNPFPYWCPECGIEHWSETTIGKEHMKYRKMTFLYWCSKCGIEHFSENAIGKKHMKYFDKFRWKLVEIP